MKQKNLMALVAIIGIVTGFFISHPVQAAAQEDCEINSPKDATDFDNGQLTFRMAMNRTMIGVDPNLRICTKSIKISAPTINFVKPLLIEVPPGGYTIEGKSEEQPTVFDFSALSTNGTRKPTDPMKRCVVTFYNTTQVTLKNITISGGPASGICFGVEGDATRVSDIKLENVKVSGATAGNGLVFWDSAQKNSIDFKSSVEQVGGSAVVLHGGGNQNSNKINATDREIGVVNSATGFVQLQALDNAHNFKMTNIGSEKFVDSDKMAQLRVTVKQLQGNNYLVKGSAVVASKDSKDDLCKADAQKITDLSLLQVYLGKTKANIVDGGFYGYVGPMNDTHAGYGIWKRGPKQGDFWFIFDASGDYNGLKQLALVPEFADSGIGGASALVELVENWSTCDGAVIPDVSVSSAGTVGMVNNYVAANLSTAACLAARGGTDIDGNPIVNIAPDATLDSDGDGIPDVKEDSNGDCQCDAGDLSCWKLPDSDHDGIPDGDEIYSKASLVDIQTLTQMDANNHLIRGTTPFCGTDLAADPCNSDRDRVSDATQEDSDSDGKKDSEEDRSSRTFIKHSTGYFKLYQGFNQSQTRVPLLDADGKTKVCNFSGDDAANKGMEVGLWVLTWDDNHKLVGDPIGWDQQTSANGNQTIQILLCQNETVLDLNFDGRKDAPGETDLTKVDTDGDNICDGNGLRCDKIPGFIATAINDKCPLVKNTNADGTSSFDPNACQLECESGEVLRFVPVEERESPTGGLKKNPDGQYHLFAPLSDTETVEARAARIRSTCGGDLSDLDSDGIPDCIELPSGNCQDLSTQSGHLNPYNADTDGDKVADGIDVNPFDVNVKGIDTITNNDDLNSLRRLFVDHSNSTLMLFVDRDQDGLKDAQEDKNLDGQFDNTKSGIENRPFAESDPLKVNSDDDDLTDKEEVTRGTNPQDADTDHDGLKDDQESKSVTHEENTKDMASRNGKTQLETSEIGCKLYGPSESIGTSALDPDSDNDGIPDGVEVAVGVDQIKTTVYTGSISDLLQQANGNPKLFPSAGFRFASNPLNSDSDGDTKKDGAEVGPDGIMKFTETNPCDSDTDGDGKYDNDPTEAGACADIGGIGSARCQAGMVNGSPDSDGDGIPDVLEDSNPNGIYDGPGTANCPTGKEPIGPGGCDYSNFMAPDTDNDGLWDGEEDTYTDAQVGQIQTTAIPSGIPGTQATASPSVSPAPAPAHTMTMGADGVPVAATPAGHPSGAAAVDGIQEPGQPDPRNADSDGDGLSDGIEVHVIGTNPAKEDTDGDCISDGKELTAQGKTAPDISYIQSVHTNPLSTDTDQDGLPDGFIANIGEDKDCDGKVGIDAKGVRQETDPRSKDTDLDGVDDYHEMTRGGFFNTANIKAAVSGRRRTIFSCSTAADAPVSSPAILYVFGAALFANRIMTRGKTKARAKRKVKKS